MHMPLVFLVAWHLFLFLPMLGRVASSSIFNMVMSFTFRISRESKIPATPPCTAVVVDYERRPNHVIDRFPHPQHVSFELRSMEDDISINSEILFQHRHAFHSSTTKHFMHNVCILACEESVSNM